MNWQTTALSISGWVGHALPSISGRADITLVSFDPHVYVVRRASDGVEIQRRTAELVTVAGAMTLNTPVHVDATLGGSGSSRNQPETVLANLPEVEWTRVDGRKHIV